MNNYSPSHLRDKVILMKVAEAGVPGDHDKVILAALMIRHQGAELEPDIDVVIRCWGMTRESLFAQARSIWASGFRPPAILECGSSHYDLEDS